MWGWILTLVFGIVMVAMAITTHSPVSLIMFLFVMAVLTGYGTAAAWRDIKEQRDD